MSKYIELVTAQVTALTEQRDAALNELDDIATVLEGDPDNGVEARTATDDENTRIDELRNIAENAETERGVKQAELDQLESIAEARANTAKRQPKPTALGFIGEAGGGDNPYDIDLRSAPRTREVRRDIQDRALRAVEIDEWMDDEQRGQVDKMLRDRKVNRGGALARHILLTGDPEYRDAFLDLITPGQPMLTERQADLVRATIEVGTDANGGYLMPFTLDPTVILTSNGVVNPVRARADVGTVATDNWQGITSAGITASYDAEGTEVSDDSPTFGQPAIAIHQAQAWAEYTVQAGDDLDGLADELSTMFADARDTLELSVFTTGDGSDKPYGFVTDATAVASATTDTYAVGDVYALQNAVAPRWQQNATWMASLPVINLTRQFGTAVGHAFLTDLGGGQPPALLGQSLDQNSGMDSVINATQDNKILAYGDFRQYRIRDRIGMSVEFVPTVMGANRRPTGKRGWYVRWRNGARLSVADAVQVLNVT